MRPTTNSIFALAFSSLCAFLIPLACTDDGGATDAGTEGEGECVPGQSVACSCDEGGGTGAMTCEPDGSGFGICMCTFGDGDGDPTTGDGDGDPGDGDGDPTAGDGDGDGDSGETGGTGPGTTDSSDGGDGCACAQTSPRGNLANFAFTCLALLGLGAVRRRRRDA
jgi:hypothetical protein